VRFLLEMYVANVVQKPDRAFQVGHQHFIVFEVLFNGAAKTEGEHLGLVPLEDFDAIFENRGKIARLILCVGDEKVVHDGSFSLITHFILFFVVNFHK